MLLTQYLIPGLGHISTLVGDDLRGVAAVVDPRRDVDLYLRELEAHDLRLTHVVETHLHNDYVSGGRELAALTGAVHVIGAGAEPAYEVRGVRDGDLFDVGALRFRVLATPGHTPEHVGYSVADRSRADEPLALFSGGSLLVGAVGRTDLLGADNALPFARAMFDSLRSKLLSHEDFVGVYPTHGAGSLCSKEISTTPSSTVGFERRHNPLLQVDEVEAFCRALLADQPAFPRYFARMRPTNQAGPRPLGAVPAPHPLPAGAVRERLAAAALLLDLRPAADHGAAHVPGSISVPAGPSFGTWLGWIVPHDRPLVLLLERVDDWDDAVRQALRIGYERIEGYLHGGFEAWESTGGPVESTGRLTARELAARLASEGPARSGNRGLLVVDVRQWTEYARGHVPGALHLMAGDLPERLAELDRDRPIATICMSGNRAVIAASLLQRAGFRDVAWVSGGLPTWRAAGFPVESSAE